MNNNWNPRIDKRIEKHTVKRLNNEVIELYSKYKNLNIKYTEEIIVLKINNIEIHINNKYPFHAPAIFITLTPPTIAPPTTAPTTEENNPIPYIKYLITKSKLITKLLEKYIKKECLCCSTIICAANWVATYNIQKILDEISYINELKRIVKYEIALINLYDKEKLPEEVCAHILTYL